MLYNTTIYGVTMMNITSILGVVCKDGLFEDCPVWKNCCII